MAGTKTDNHFTADKVRLRADMTAHLDTIRVLDAFGGHGVVWGAVARLTGKKIERVPVDKRLDLELPHLHGDNLKVVQGLYLGDFDVVDLDAYGVAADLIKLVVQEKKFAGTVFITFVQSMTGIMPKLISTDLGLPPSLSRECPSLISRRGWEFFKAWLAGMGIEQIQHRSWSRKHYLGFYANGYSAATA